MADPVESSQAAVYQEFLSGRIRIARPFRAFVKIMKSKQMREDRRKAQLRESLWREVHTRQMLPINHPIPRLNPPLRTRCRLHQIELFVQTRVARISATAMVLLLAAVCSGCSVVEYRGSGGDRFSRMTIGSRTALTGLEVETGTNGLRRLSLRGYRSDSADSLGVVTEAAVRAALQK
jgi:hypothetical protein